MKAYERLLKYVAINTPCDETSNTTPSSKCQFDLANLLKDEMQLLGVSDIHLTSPNIVFSMENFQPRKDMKMLLHLVLLLI